MRLARLVLTCLLAGSALLLGVGTAFAHNVLTSSDPADGATLPTGPPRVTLNFDLPVQEGFNTVTVIGPDGLQYQNGTATLTAGAVTVAVNPLGPAGRYTIGYRIVSDDGHPVSGSIGFTLSQAGTGRGVPGPAPGAAPGSGDSGGVPAWPWILGAVVLLGGGAVLALRAGRT